MPWHRQVEVAYKGRRILVDEGMADLLAECWAAGMETYGSCQDQHHGTARIWFSNEKSSDRFRDTMGFETTRTSGDGWPLDFELSKRATASR